MIKGFTLNADGFYYAPPMDPTDKLDFTLDFSGIIGADTIASATWANTTGLTETVAKRSNTAKTATVWFEAGVLGSVVTVTATVTTAAGRVVERSFKIPVESL